MTSTRHDELVEEIQDIYKAGREGRLPKISPQRLISHILKAVVDGMPLHPWEVGREWLRYTYPPGRLELIPFQKWLQKIIEQAEQSGNQVLFIALSPAGAGEEVVDDDIL